MKILSPKHRTSHRRLPAAVLLLAVVVLPAASCAPARADDTAGAAAPNDAAARQARDLAAQVLRGAGDGGLGEWTRGVIARALERAGESATGTAEGTNASPAPLPAERHARRTARGLAAARPDTAEVLVFASLSVPAQSWRAWAREAARIGAPLVLRGVGPEGMRGFVKRVGERLGGHEAGVAIDPRLFRLFGVERVPAVVVVPGGVLPCRSRGCSGDPPPAHDRVTGNIGLVAALEAIAAEGGAGRAVASAGLERLKGERR